MINNLRDKYARIKVQQELADRHNAQFDQMEQDNVDLALIPKAIREQDKQHRHTKFLATTENPYEKQDHVIGSTGRMGQGYDRAHQVPSQTKDMNCSVESNYKAYQLTKKNKEQEHPQAYIKNKEKQAQAKQMRREQIYKDHVQNLFKVVDNTAQQRTDYGGNFVYEDEMKKLHSTRDYAYHQKMNDLKFYNEEYVKCKEFLRKC